MLKRKHFFAIALLDCSLVCSLNCSPDGSLDCSLGFRFGLLSRDCSLGLLLRIALVDSSLGLLSGLLFRLLSWIAFGIALLDSLLDGSPIALLDSPLDCSLACLWLRFSSLFGSHAGVMV